MKKVVIVGAGFSGLSLAHELNKAGLQVEIFEKQERVGGMISSPLTLQGFYETAANGFLNTKKIQDFFTETGVHALGSSENSKKRYIYIKKPRRWPLSFFQTFYFLIKLTLFLCRKKINQMPRAQQSVENWANQNFGSAATHAIVSPALQGIYAGDIKKLSASLIFLRLLRKNKKSQTDSEKKRGQSSLVSGPGGMGAVMTQIKENLVARGVVFHLGESWPGVDQTSKTIIATSIFDAPAVLETFKNDAVAASNAKLLRNVESVCLVSVTHFFQRLPEKYIGFGILFPRGQDIKALGVLMNSVIFKRTQKENENLYSETWILGGALNPEIINYSDEQILDQLKNDRQKTFLIDVKPIHSSITRWPQALPHYSIEWEKTLAELKPMQSIILHGNYLGTLGLSRILERSQEISLQIKNELVLQTQSESLEMI